MAVNNVTEHYRLPLPTSNEVMQYQDFINDANNLLDAALWENKQAVVAAQTDATNALTQGAENNTKLEALTAQITEYDIPGIKTKQSAINDRLEVVEDEVMTFVAPTVIPGTQDGSALVVGWIKAGGFMFQSNVVVSSNSVLDSLDTGTETPAYGNFILSGKYVNTVPISLMEASTISGNILNLSENNKWYVVSRNNSIFTENSNGLNPRADKTFCFVRYNGVNTQIALSRVSTQSGYHWIQFLAIPLGVN